MEHAKDEYIWIKGLSFWWNQEKDKSNSQGLQLEGKRHNSDDVYHLSGAGKLAFYLQYFIYHGVYSWTVEVYIR